MFSLRLVVAAASLLAATAFASPTEPRNGAEYSTLATPQPVQSDARKVEVVEFFMYHCPFCNAVEPALMDWVKKQGDKVSFRRVHFPYHGPADPEAHLFLTLEAMGKEVALHDSILKVWHVDHKHMSDDAANLEWAQKNGIDKAAFLEVYNSFGVTTRLRGLQRVVSNYGIDSAPTLVIGGRYMTSPSMVGATNSRLEGADLYKATFEVADALVAKAAAAK